MLDQVPVKYRVALALAGMALGFPTSYYGLAWIQTMFAKQQVDCLSDIYRADVRSEADFKKLDSQFSRCRSEIDAHIGTVEFAKRQRRRAAASGEAP